MPCEYDSQEAPIFEIIDPTHIDGLANLFCVLKNNGDDLFFHPHPLTHEEAKKKAEYLGNDLYFVMKYRGDVVGYGMLRGWDEGYPLPSLGIAVHPSARNQGFARQFIQFLHQQARERGASKVRLTVDQSNEKAIRLYKKEGYIFGRVNALHLEGFVTV